MAEPTVRRTIADLAEALRRHVKLLRQYGEKAFDDRDDDYLGEVAAKLRLLVVSKGRSNVPLLVRLMTECILDDRLTLADGPPPAFRLPGRHPGAVVTLSEFLNLPAVGIDTSAGHVILTKRQLIVVIAEKHGAAHEDWKHPESFALLRGYPLRLAGYHPMTVELGLTTRAVLELADRILSQLTPEVIEQAESRRRSVP